MPSPSMEDGSAREGMRRFLDPALLPVGLWLVLWGSLATPLSDFALPDTLSSTVRDLRVLYPIFLAPVLAVWLAVRGRGALRVGRPTFWMLLYGVTSLISTLCFSPEPAEGLRQAACFFSVLLLGYAIRGSDVLTRSLKWIVQLQMIAGIFHVGYTSSTRIIGFPRWKPRSFWLDFTGRVSRSAEGRFSALTLLWGLVMLSATGARRRAYGLGLAVLGGVVLVWSCSKISILGAVVGGLLLIVGNSKRTPWPVLVALIPLLLLPVFLWAVEIRMTEDPWVSLQSRQELWRSLWTLGLESPWLGQGFGLDLFRTGQFAHNALLLSFLQGGWPGLLLFGATVVSVVRLSWRSLRCGDGIEFQKEAAITTLFLTLRGLSESSMAGFSVDLLIWAAAVHWLEHLDTAESRVGQRIFSTSGL